MDVMFTGAQPQEKCGILYLFVVFWLLHAQGRRATAVRAIDQRLGRAKEGHFYERKVRMSI